MHVNQRPETALRTAKHPVDRTLLVTSDMIIVKLIQEEITDAVSAPILHVEGVLNKAKVLFVIILTKCDPQEILEPLSDIISDQSPSRKGITLSTSGAKVGSGTR